MFRRVVWMSMGAAAGVWAVLRMQRAASRLTPSSAADEVWRQVRHLSDDIVAAVAAGRVVKRSTEADLRQMARARSAIEVAVIHNVPSIGSTDEGLARR